MKKLVSFVLALAMILTMCPLAVFANEQPPVEKHYFEALGKEVDCYTIGASNETVAYAFNVESTKTAKYGNEPIIELTPEELMIGIAVLADPDHETVMPEFDLIDEAEVAGDIEYSEPVTINLCLEADLRLSNRNRTYNYSSDFIIPENLTVYLNLNGYDFDINCADIIIEEGGALIIEDDSATSRSYAFIDDDDEEFDDVWHVVTSGAITMPSASLISDCGYIQNKGTVEINNASFLSDNSGLSLSGSITIDYCLVKNEGTLNLNNAMVVINNLSPNHTGVYLAPGSKMNMNGGYIYAMDIDNGPSVFIDKDSTFNLKDGAIFNIAAIGAQVVDHGTLKVSGYARIGDPLGLGGVSVFESYNGDSAEDFLANKRGINPDELETTVGLSQLGRIVIDGTLSKDSASPSITLLPNYGYEITEKSPTGGSYDFEWMATGYDENSTIVVEGTDNSGCIGMALGASAFTKSATADGFTYSRSNTDATNSIGLNIGDIVITDGIQGVGLNLELTGLANSDTARINEFLKLAYNGYVLGQTVPVDHQFYNYQFPELRNKLGNLDEDERNLITEILDSIDDMLAGKNGSPTNLSLTGTQSSFTILNNIELSLGNNSLKIAIKDFGKLVDDIPQQLKKNAGENLYYYFTKGNGQSLETTIDSYLYYIIQDYWEDYHYYNCHDLNMTWDEFKENYCYLRFRGMEIGADEIEMFNEMLGAFCGMDGVLYSEDECMRTDLAEYNSTYYYHDITRDFNSSYKRNLVEKALDFAAEYMDMDNPESGIRSIFNEMLPGMLGNCDENGEPIPFTGEQLSDCVEEVLNFLLETEVEPGVGLADAMVGGYLEMFADAFGVGFYQKAAEGAAEKYEADPIFSINELFNTGGVYSIGFIEMEGEDEQGNPTLTNLLGLTEDDVTFYNKNDKDALQAGSFFILKDYDCGKLIGKLFDDVVASTADNSRTAQPFRMANSFNYRIGKSGNITLPDIICLVQRPKVIEDSYTREFIEETSKFANTGSVSFEPVNAGIVEKGMKVNLAITSLATKQTTELKKTTNEGAGFGYYMVDEEGKIVVLGLEVQNTYELTYWFTYNGKSTGKLKSEAFDTFVGEMTIKIAADDNQVGNYATVTLYSGKEVIGSEEYFVIESLEGGEYGASIEFSKLPDGFYNLVLDYNDGEYTNTKFVEIRSGILVELDEDGHQVDDPCVEFSTKKTTVDKGNGPVEVFEELSTIIDIDKDEDLADAIIADVVVAGLEQVADSTLTEELDGTEIITEVKLIVENIDEDAVENILGEDNEEFLGIISEENVAFLDLSLYVSGSIDGNDLDDMPVHETGLLTVRIPYDTTRRNISVYRYHSNTAGSVTMEQLNEGEANANENGEYIEIDQAAGVIILHVCRFSVYAIGYDDPIIAAATKNKVTIAETENGTVKTDFASAYSGAKVTITATPAEGYKLAELAVTDTAGRKLSYVENENGTYSFSMAATDVTVTAKFAKEGSYADCEKGDSCPMTAFSDIDVKQWYHDAVHYCLENGIMSGYPGGIFKPSANCSRAMIVTMLWNLEGQPVVNYEMAFEDVAATDWFVEAVRWAASNKIVSGHSDVKFAPNADITREQFVQIMYNYAVFKGIDVSVGEDTNILDYDDIFQASSWAIPALQWGVGSGLITGRSATTLNAGDTAKRVEAAQIFFNFLVEK